MGETISKIKVVQLIKDQDDEAEMVVEGSTEAWILDDGTIVQLKSGNRRIPFEIVQEIAIEQLRMNIWEFDHWYGES